MNADDRPESFELDDFDEDGEVNCLDKDTEGLFGDSLFGGATGCGGGGGGALPGATDASPQCSADGRGSLGAVGLLLLGLLAATAWPTRAAKPLARVRRLPRLRRMIARAPREPEGGFCAGAGYRVRFVSGAPGGRPLPSRRGCPEVHRRSPRVRRPRA